MKKLVSKSLQNDFTVFATSLKVPLPQTCATSTSSTSSASELETSRLNLVQKYRTWGSFHWKHCPSCVPNASSKKIWFAHSSFIAILTGQPGSIEFGRRAAPRLPPTGCCEACSAGHAIKPSMAARLRPIPGLRRPRAVMPRSRSRVQCIVR